MQARVVEMRPWTRIVSRAYGVDPGILEAVCAWETGMQGLRGPGGCWGPGQVSWAVWGRTLAREGIAGQPEALLRPWVGVWAAARVLAAWQRQVGRDRAVCAYNGAGARRRCPYRDGVEAMRRRLGR